MLTAMRKGSDNWFIKIFLGIVVLGFIATGGLLSYSSVQSNNYIATVGEANVTTTSFYNDYSRESNSYARRFGSTLQPQLLKLIEQTVVRRLVGLATMENTGINLNLAMDDKIIAKQIQEDPNFSGADGAFDKAIFEGVLRQNNLNEKSYVALLKKQQIINQLTGGLATIQSSPEIFVNIVNEFNNQQRIAEFFTILPKDIKIDTDPTGDALAAYYKTVIAQFDAPEYRKVEILDLNPISIAKTIEVNDKLVKEQYELSKSSYNSAEKRQISQILYKDVAEAAAAREKANQGISFVQLATDKGINGDSYKLGEFVKLALPNKKMAEVAFLLGKDEISQPVDTGLGVALLQVTNIIPAVVKTFDDVKAQIIKQEALRLANDQIYELRDQVEDEIAGGSEFSEIAKKFNIALTSIDNIDANAKDTSSNPVTIPNVIGLLSGIFASEALGDNEPLDTPTNGLIWYKVNAITKSHNKELSLVQDKVLDLWRSTKTNESLLSKANDFVEKAGDIETLSNGITEEIQISSAVKRNVPSLQLSTEAINALFTLKQDGYAHTPTLVEGKSAYIIMQLKEIIAPDTENMDDINKQIRASIAPELATTLIESYVENNQTLYGSSINQPLIDRVTGVQPQN